MEVEPILRTGSSDVGVDPVTGTLLHWALFSFVDRQPAIATTVDRSVSDACSRMNTW